MTPRWFGGTATEASRQDHVHPAGSGPAARRCPMTPRSVEAVGRDRGEKASRDDHVHPVPGRIVHETLIDYTVGLSGDGQDVWHTLSTTVRALTSADDNKYLETAVSVNGTSGTESTRLTFVDNFPVALFREKDFIPVADPDNVAQPGIVWKTVNTGIGNVASFGHTNMWLSRLDATTWRYAMSHNIAFGVHIVIRLITL